MGLGFAVSLNGCLGADDLDFEVGGGYSGAAGGRGLGDQAVVDFGVIGDFRVTDGPELESAMDPDLEAGGGINAKDGVVEAAPSSDGRARGHSMLPSVMASSEDRLLPSVLPLDNARCNPAF